MSIFKAIAYAMLAAGQLSLCSAAAVRVALMPSGDPKAAAVVDLMEVELAQNDIITLLDRSNVGRILAEQKIVLDDALSSDDAFAVGKLLRCDVFGELYFKTGNKGESSVCVFKAFDAVTGVRLCDVTLDASLGLAEIAVSAYRSLTVALRKRDSQEAGDKVRAVTLVSARNVDLPRDQEHLVDAVGPILERKLLGSSGITLLERQRLDLVNEEAALTEDLRKQLLSSTVLLDLDLSRGDSEEAVRIRAMVSNPGGKEVAVVEVEHETVDLGGLIDVFTQDLLVVLELPAVKTIEGSNQREADRFANECRRLLAKNQLREALTAAECAHALHPSDIEIQAMLCDILERVSQEQVQKAAFETALQILERTWSFRQQWQATGHSRRTPYPQMSLECLLAQKQKLSTEQQERFARIRRLFQQRWLSDPYRRLDYVNLWAETPDEWMDTLLAYGNGYPEEFSTPRFQHLVWDYRAIRSMNC